VAQLYSYTSFPNLQEIQAYEYIEAINKGYDNLAILIYKLSKPLRNTCIRVHLSLTSHINHHKQSSRNGIHMFYSIQTHRHIGTSSIEFHINHSMYFSCNDIYIWVKYILAPQTTTLSPDGHPNYQCLDYGPPNYYFLIFWPHPSIYAVNCNRNWPKTRKYPSLNRGNFKVYEGYFRISI
jgi:hypothetical protein